MHKKFNTQEYNKYIEDFFSNFKENIERKRDIIPKFLGIHLANRGCSNKCIFCISGSEKVNELSLSAPEIFLEKLTTLLQLKKINEDGTIEYIKEIHFDGDSSDPVLPKTEDILKKSIKLIRNIEKKDNLKRSIHIITNGHNIACLDKELLRQIDLINISINAYNSEIYRIFSGSNNFERILKNLNALCRLLDIDKTDTDCVERQINVSYVISRYCDKNLNNFNKDGLIKFIRNIELIGVDCIKFRFDFNEKNKKYQDYISLYINSLAKKYNSIKIIIQKTYSIPGFNYCIAPFIWPVLGPDIRIYSCPHAISDELEAIPKNKTVSSIRTEKQFLCNWTCPPFIFNLNLLLNKNENERLLNILNEYYYSNTIYPLIYNIDELKSNSKT